MTLHIFRHIRLQEVSPVFDWWNGVVVLFCISGFLVPASMERSKNTWEFLKKRVLRIIPSLWVCIKLFPWVIRKIVDLGSRLFNKKA